MKIADIRCDVVRLPPSDLLPGAGLDVAVVRVVTDTGIEGLGEASSAAHAVRAVLDAPATGTLSLAIRDVLVGRDPLEIGALWEDLYQLTMYPGHRGLFLHAISAIDIALWDILGKATGLPVHTLLGGALTREMPVYATQLMPESPVEIRRAAERTVGEGWPALKFGWLPRPGGHDRDLQLVRAAREGAGPDADLMIDVGRGWESRGGHARALPAWDHRTAARRIRSWEEADLLWVEEPLAADDLDGYRRLVEAVDTPIAAGEQETSRFAMHALVERGGIDIVQPDVARVGGLTEARRVAHAAADRHRMLAPHCYGSPIQFIASAHLAVTCANSTPLEYPLMLSQAPPLVHPAPRPDGGVFTLSEAPGLGVELDEELFEELRVPPA